MDKLWYLFAYQMRWWFVSEYSNGQEMPNLIRIEYQRRECKSSRTRCVASHANCAGFSEWFMGAGTRSHIQFSMRLGAVWADTDAQGNRIRFGQSNAWTLYLLHSELGMTPIDVSNSASIFHIPWHQGYMEREKSHESFTTADGTVYKIGFFSSLLWHCWIISGRAGRTDVKYTLCIDIDYRAGIHCLFHSPLCKTSPIFISYENNAHLGVCYFSIRLQCHLLQHHRHHHQFRSRCR